MCVYVSNIFSFMLFIQNLLSETYVSDPQLAGKTELWARKTHTPPLVLSLSLSVLLTLLVASGH